MRFAWLVDNLTISLQHSVSLIFSYQYYFQVFGSYHDFVKQPNIGKTYFKNEIRY